MLKIIDFVFINNISLPNVNQYKSWSSSYFRNLFVKYHEELLI